MKKFLLIFRRAEAGLAFISCVLLLVMMLVIDIDITGRAIFNRPLQMGLEMTELLMVFIVFLGFAYTQKERVFVRIELFTSHLPQSGRRTTEYINYIVSIAFFTAFCWRTIIHAWDSLMNKELTTGLVPLPIYPAKIAIAIGGIFLLGELIIGVVEHYYQGKT